MLDSRLRSIQTWLTDLKQVVDEQNMADDKDIVRQVSLLEIEFEGLCINLPDVDDSLAELLFSKHSANISDGVLTILRAVLGYYALPQRIKGDNEPVLGPELAHELKTKLMDEQVDIFGVTYELAQLLEQENNQSEQ